MIDSDSIEATVPLAVYRLGYLSFAARMWQELNWKLVSIKNIDTSTGLAIDQLSFAVLILNKGFDNPVMSRLDEAIKEHRRFNESIIEHLNNLRAQSRCPAQERPPYDQSLDDLRRVADHALAEDTWMRSLYVAGAALGNYELELTRFDPPALNPHDMNNSPSVQPLVQIICSLPNAILDEVPWLLSMKRLAPLLTDADQSQFFDQLISKNKIECDDLSFGECYGHICNAISKLNVHIQHHLGQLANDFAVSDLPSPLAGEETTNATDSKPCFRSCAGGYELLYENKVAKIFSHKAKNVIILLQAFEDAHWQERINNPFRQAITTNEHGQLASETIRSLKVNLRYLHFCMDGLGTGIIWSPLSPP